MGRVKFHLVTTMNEKGWQESGQRMVESIIRHWPASALPITVYAEGFTPPPMAGLQVRELPGWLETFKAKWGRSPSHRGWRPCGYDYRFDAVKFAHKVAALTDFGFGLTDGVMIVLDADTFTHADVDEAWLNKLFPKPHYMAWLDRLNSHPECGFVMYRCSHPYHRAFMEAFRTIYTSGALFKMRETHDSYVLQQLVNAEVRCGKIPAPVSLSGDSAWHHPFVNGPLGARMDHMKGPARKAEGHSRRRDLRRPRQEPYWQGIPHGG